MKEYCVHNHDTRANGRNAQGRCRTCCLLATQRYQKTPMGVTRRKEYYWEKAEIKNADGSSFRTVDFDRLYQLQQGCCKICGVHQSDLRRRLDVDHSHITGIVRALLCGNCNIKVGAFESPLADKIQAYLGDI